MGPLYTASMTSSILLFPEKQVTRRRPRIYQNLKAMTHDFLNEGQKLCMGEESTKNFLEELKHDIEFLAQLKIMEYSLLVGVHNTDQAEQEEVEVQERAEDGECKDDEMGGNLPCSPGTPLDGPATSPAFLGPLVLGHSSLLWMFMP